MRLEAEIDGRRYQVGVTEGDDGLAITLDGRPLSVDARTLDGFFTSILAGGKAYETTVEPDGEGAFRVQVGIEAHRVLFLDPLRPERAGRGDGDASRDGGVSGPVLSLMPGKVVRVLVRAGDAVVAGQDLVVVEAMKMENAVQAPAPGRVQELFVAPGDAVEAGAPLILIG